MCQCRSGVFRNGSLYWWNIESTPVSVLFESALYNNKRNTYFADIFNHDNSDTLDDNLVCAMTNHPRMLPKCLVHADLLRRKYMYKWNNNVNYTYNVLYIYEFLDYMWYHYCFSKILTSISAYFLCTKSNCEWYFNIYCYYTCLNIFCNLYIELF